MERDLLRLQEVCNRLGIKLATGRKWVKLGRLPAVRVGNLVMVRTTDYQAFLDALPPRPPGTEPKEATRVSLVRRKRRV